MTGSRPPRPLEQLLAELAGHVRRRLDPRTLAAAIRAEDSLNLEVEVPLNRNRRDLGLAAATLESEIASRAEALRDQHDIPTPGAALCLRCDRVGCEHGRPPSPRHVFAGFGPTGLPLFLDLPQLLVDRGDDRVDRLFEKRRNLLTRVETGAALTSGLLPAWRKSASGHYLHGLLVAGWLPGPAGQRRALSFLLISSRGSQSRRWALQPVFATEMETDSLDQAAKPSAWRSLPSSMEEDLVRLAAMPHRGPHRDEQARAVEGALRRAAGILERPDTRRRSQTAHAQARHEAGDRPTAQSLADLLSAATGRTLHDQRKQTFVVAGPRGRTHVFAPDGRLVTSVRYPPGTWEKRIQQGRWRPLTNQEAEALRAAVKARRSPRSSAPAEGAAGGARSSPGIQTKKGPA